MDSSILESSQESHLSSTQMIQTDEGYQAIPVHSLTPSSSPAASSSSRSKKRRKESSKKKKKRLKRKRSPHPSRKKKRSDGHKRQRRRYYATDDPPNSCVQMLLPFLPYICCGLVGLLVVVLLFSFSGDFMCKLVGPVDVVGVCGESLLSQWFKPMTDVTDSLGLSDGGDLGGVGPGGVLGSGPALIGKGVDAIGKVMPW